MQRLDAVALQPRAHGFAHLRRNRRHRRQPPRQRLEIQAGAADENRQAVLPARFRQHLCRIGHPVTRGKIHPGIDVAIEPVRNLGLLIGRRPRRDDAQIAIHLHGIGVDDDAAGFLRKRKRQRRLAAGGRPCDKHGVAGVLSRIHLKMSLVATLICNPADPALDSTVVDGARAILPSPGPAHWLFGEVAVDIPFTGSDDIRAIEARLRQARGDLPIDIVVQPQALRRKKLFLADMDSTMIGQECIDELADFAGLKAHVAGITERAMRGEIEFEPALRERVALLKGLPVSVIDEVIEKRIRLMPGARALVMTMRAYGAYTCLVSGGFTLFTDRIAALIGFDENRANKLVIESGKLAGRVEEPILGRKAKLEALKALTG